MFARICSRLTYANVVATLALFLSLGGVSYAAVVVTGASIKNGTITGADIKAKSVPLSKLAVKPAALRGPKGDPGASGPAGATGPRGEQGPAGPVDPTQFVAAGKTSSLTVSGANWRREVGTAGAATVQKHGVRISGADTEFGSYSIAGQLPSTISGAAVKVTSIDVCADLTSNFIGGRQTDVRIYRGVPAASGIPGTPLDTQTPGSPVLAATAQCRNYPLAVPVAVPSTGVVELWVDFEWDGSADALLGNVAFNYTAA